MLFCEDTSDEMERGLLERFEMDRGFFVSLGSPPTGLPGRGEEHDKRTTAVQQRNHYLVTTQSVGRGRRVMQGRRGAPWRSWVPRRAKKVEPRCLGSPPMRGRKDPESIIKLYSQLSEMVTWSGEGRDFKEGEGEPIDDNEDSKAAFALCGLFSSCSPSSSSSSSSPPPSSNWPLGARVLPSWSNLVASIS